MIFIWTADGGPLQYGAMFLLILVQLLPNLINMMTESQPSNSSRDQTASRTSSSPEPWTTDDSIRWIALSFVLFFGIFTAIVVANSNRLRGWLNRPRNRNGADREARWAVWGFATGVLLCFLWFINRPGSPNSLYGSFTDAYLLLVSLVQVGGFVWMLQQFFSNEDNGLFPRNNNRQASSAKMARIVAKIHAMPLEGFVKDDLGSYASLKIARLQQMLQVRGNKENYLERSEIVSALKKRRKYSDSCCICCEDYLEREDTLRIWPKCNHEFHLECLDQWAYTFQNKADLPTCPLCKESL